jgi:hypothetical protein
MENLNLKFNDIAAYNAVIRDSVPEVGGIDIITLDAGTTSGRAIAVISFKASVDGRIVNVQAATTIRLLLTALAGLHGRYDEDGMVRIEG